MAVEFEIEHGIPIPESNPRLGVTWARMEVGDSILIPEGIKSIKSVQRAASSYGSRHGKTFKSRTVEGGMRIWRVA